MAHRYALYIRRLFQQLLKRVLKNGPVAARYERRSSFHWGISAVADRRYSQKRLFQRLLKR